LPEGKVWAIVQSKTSRTVPIRSIDDEGVDETDIGETNDDDDF
jgi:hypothetical protein